MYAFFVRAATLLTTLFTLTMQVSAQTAIPFTDSQWQFTENTEAKPAGKHVIGSHLGREGLLLQNSVAELSQASFQNGIIEYDLAFPGGRGFVFLRFRVQDDANYESFYIRPHQSGNPDATQYMPVFNGQESWQLYHGKGFNGATPLPKNQWMHVKLVISEKRMEAFIDEKLVLVAPALKRFVQPGSIGIAANGDLAYFANFQYRSLDNPPMQTAAQPEAAADPAAIQNWQVSETFPEASLSAVERLDAAKQSHQWKDAHAEANGLLNLATTAQWTEANNTAFVRLVIHSEQKQYKALRFGFSDRARVYLNKQLLYTGHDEFMSRDYRFLGSVGLYDEIFLPLEKGRNELLIAITDDFGGWGLKAEMPDRKGVRLERK